MNSTTERLAKGFGYACKPSIVEAALSANGRDVDWRLSRSATATFFECFFWPPNPDNPGERLYLRAGAVPSPAVGAARRFLEAEVLPAFVSWVDAIMALPAGSTVRREQQHFERTLPAELLGDGRSRGA